MIPIVLVNVIARQNKVLATTELLDYSLKTIREHWKDAISEKVLSDTIIRKKKF